MGRSRSGLAVALALAVLAAACGSPAGGPPPGATAETKGSTSERAVPRAQATTIRTVEGGDVAVPDPQGRPVVLFFMAAWCVSCIAGAVMLDELYRDYGPRGLRVVAIDVDPGDTAADLARFRELAGNPQYLWAVDEGQRLTRAYGVRSLDATILVSGAGEVLFRSESLPDPDRLRRAVQRALGL